MKKISTLAVLLLMLVSCTKKSSTSSTTPGSTFNITYNGKSYNLSGNPPTTIISANTNGPSSISNAWGTLIGGQNSHISCQIGGTKVTDLSTAIGTYKAGEGNGTVFGVLNLTDYDDGHKQYTSDFSGADTTSTIMITVSNSTEVKGTFKVILTYNGNYYPATGDFDYKH